MDVTKQLADALLALEEVVACDPSFDEHYPKTRQQVERALAAYTLFAAGGAPAELLASRVCWKCEAQVDKVGNCPNCGAPRRVDD